MRVYLLFFFLFFFPQGWLYQPSGPRMSQEDSFWRKLKVLVPYLSDQKIGGHLSPLPRSYFLKVTGSKFWDTHFIHNSRKSWQLCPWGWLTPLQSLWEGLQVTNFDQCLHLVMVIEKCTDLSKGIFFGWGGVEERGLCEGNFQGRNLSRGKRISMKGVQNFLALKKNKNKYEKVFLNWKKGAALKQTEIITYVRSSPPPQNSVS